MSNEATKTTDNSGHHFFRASATDFKKIPGSPIAYWLPNQALKILDKTVPLESFAVPRKGMCTRDNDYFVRTWQEVSLINIGFGCRSRSDSVKSGKRWFPYQKGGQFRQWYGNHLSVVDWENDGYRLLHMEELGWPGGSTNHNLEYIFSSALVWSKITSSTPNFRYSPEGFLFDDASGMCSIKQRSRQHSILGLLCSKVGQFYMTVINPTLNIQPGNMSAIPVLNPDIETRVNRIIEISKADWDSFELSWDFTSPLLMHLDYRQYTLKATYQKFFTRWKEMTLEMQCLEQENNRIFIDAYGLQDELIPEVPLNEITLTCNPHYRYGNNKKEEELEVLLLADTIKELISYSVGCMFGRYSLDKSGLILANQGETFADYLKKIPEPSFPADEDNVIPMLDSDWFTDDITDRFCKFLKVTFGGEHYDENLVFIEKALDKDIRKYFLKDFYNDHVKRYKKRPIYWLFSSPKGTFNALIYMHRYRPDTVSVVLNDYLREFRTKLSAHKNHLEAISISASASSSDKTKALKEIENLKKMIDELDTYEREVLYPLATEQLAIDLDDGVKVNYGKFGFALKKIPGLDAKEEE